MNTFKVTGQYLMWRRSLADHKVRAHVQRRLYQARNGNFGEWKSAGAGVLEMKIDIGSGYRIYYAREGKTVYVLLVGGDKSSQRRDIALAKALWRQLKETAHGT